VTEIKASFQEDLKQGQDNTILVEGNGEPVKNAQVYANEIQKGQTDIEGQLKFEIPETDTVTIYAEKNGTNFEELFSAEQPVLQYDMFNPSDNVEEPLDSSFIFNVESNENFEYQLLLNDKLVSSDQLNEGTHAIEEEWRFWDEGSKEWNLELESDTESLSTQKISFDVDSASNPELDIQRPTDGQEIEDYNVDIEFDLDPLVEDNMMFDLKLNDEVIKSHNFDDNYEEYDGDLVETGLQQGSHDLEIALTDNVTDTVFTEQISFETTESPPLLDILELEESSVFNSDSGNHEIYLSHSFDLFEEAESKIYFEDEEVEEYDYDQSEHFTMTQIDVDSTGTYEWYKTFESKESDRVFETETREINVE